ncbi:MAG: glycosyltransferase [Deltaproteobacteria bacterium]|nr:glycosyltransferase [Deltaproteobacteria bacterium]MBN2671154.1 glycosyltransferase [Deltaproteobacteria bacterium]
MNTNYNKLSVLIPAYNEESRIETTLRETRRFLESIDIPYEIVVVDDGSGDRTFEAANRLADDTIKVHRSPQNGGKGQALKTAFRYSEGDLVLFLDADLDIHPDQCVPLLEAIQQPNVQAAIGSKLHPDAKIQYPLTRRIMSRGYSLMVQILFSLPLRDTQTGIKLFEAQVLKQVFHLVELDGYAFDLELLSLANRNGFSIVEVPIKMNFGTKRNHMTSKVVLNMFKDTVALFWRLQRMPRHSERNQ